MPRDDVDVVIVAHQAGVLLLAAVRSAAEQAGAEHVIVVDAESTDGSVSAMAEEFPDVRVVPVPNRGFSAGNNAGADVLAAGEPAPYLLLLNPDAELLPGALDALVDLAEARPHVAVVGAKILNADGSLQANAFGRFPSLPQAIGLRFWRAWQRLRGNARLSPRDFREPKRVDWTTGACMLVCRDAYEQVGGMDEEFFLYYEDVDLCRRVREAGWDVVVEPRAECVHHLGKSGGDSPRVQQAYRESFERYCRKYGKHALLLFGGGAASMRAALGGRR